MSRLPFALQRGLPIAHIHAGDVLVAREPTLITTVLGSCVSVTFFSARLKAAAMCHAQFAQGTSAPPSRKLFYADCAVRHMMECFSAMGARRDEIVVKVFGGADVLEVLTSHKGGSVGHRNLEAALAELSSHGLTPVAHDVRGERGRRLYFFTDTGEVLLRKVRKHTVDGNL